jgi:hypothetical protein
MSNHYHCFIETHEEKNQLIKKQKTISAYAPLKRPVGSFTLQADSNPQTQYRGYSSTSDASFYLDLASILT